MTKSEFLNTLEKSLSMLSYEEKKDILYDYEEHFISGREEGKTEEEICKKLGDPRNIAKNYTANYTLEKVKSDPSSKNVARAILAGISLSFLNLIIGLPIIISIYAVLFGLFIGAIGVSISGIILICASFIPMFQVVSLPIDVYINPFVTITFGIGITACGILWGIGNWYLIKFATKFIVNYLNWNLKAIKS